MFAGGPKIVVTPLGHCLTINQLRKLHNLPVPHKFHRSHVSSFQLISDFVYVHKKRRHMKRISEAIIGEKSTKDLAIRQRVIPRSRSRARGLKRLIAAAAATFGQDADFPPQIRRRRRCEYVYACMARYRT